LSVSPYESDGYHVAVAAGIAHDSNWKFLCAWVRSGDVFFDLGANIGTISIPMAALGATVHSFELLGANVEHLVKSVNRNEFKRVSVMIGAIGDQEGFAGIAGFSAWGVAMNSGLVSIPRVILDTYVARREIQRVDIIKIDVEGSELQALRGAKNTIERDHPDIVIECNAVSCGNNNYSYLDLLKALSSFGYSIYRLHENYLVPWNQNDVQEVVYTDYLATTKQPAEVEFRSGWNIQSLTKNDIIASIKAQDENNSLHRLYVLAIAERLPQAVRTDPTVQVLLGRWASLQTQEVMEVLKVGSA
jgi:FkbM family methyltransferase